MKRTRLFRQAKSTISGAPAELPADSETGSTTINNNKPLDIAPKKKSKKLSFENLTRNRVTTNKKDATKVAKVTKKNDKKMRATVDLEMMKEELKQLEDPPCTEALKKICSKRLQSSFFDVPATDLAQKLLGKILVRRLGNGTILKGRIVETEAYMGEVDKASHTYEGRVTPRNLPMYMQPGTIYVYPTYGMYHCFNISSGGKGCAILLRGIEPIKSTDLMRLHRDFHIRHHSKSLKESYKVLLDHELCNGPSKLCISFQVDKALCKYSVCTCKSLWIENDRNPEDIKIVECSRIGINSAGPEWANKPLRYYIYGNTSVSKRDKKAEAELLSGD